MSRKLHARTTRGLEAVAMAEIAGRLGAEITSHGHREVGFGLHGPLAEVTALATVDDVFLSVDRLRGIGRHKSDPKLLAGISIEGAARAIDAVGEFRSVPTDPTFDVSASFLGRRNFSRFDLEDVVGEILHHELGGHYLSRRDGAGPSAPCPLSWRVHVVDDVATVGLRVADRPLHRRHWKQASIRGTLHPPVAAAMNLVAGVRPGAVVADPFCGAGTIVLERLALEPSGVVIGADIDPKAVEAAGANRRSSGRGCAELLRADAGRLPIATDSVDVVVTNPPWDRRIALVDGDVHGDGDAAEQWLGELGRIAGDGSRLAILTEQAPRAPKGFIPVLQLPMSVAGSRPTLHVFVGAAATAQPAPDHDCLYATELDRFLGQVPG